MSLADIVKALGGDLYGPWRATIPGPGHGPEDRSVSLFVDRTGRLVVTSFGRTAWQEVIDDLRDRGLIDRDKRLVGGAPSAEGWTGASRAELARGEKVRIAQAIWATGGPIAGTLAERHVRGRGIERSLPGGEALRHTMHAPVRAYDPDDRRTRPALLAAVRTADGVLSAVEITFLDRSGARADRLRLARKTVGAIPPGSAVRLDPIAPQMLVGEGIFTTLSASQRFGLPGWALLSTARLVTWTPPAGVRAVLVAGDNGRAGRAAARRLVARLSVEGVRARAAFPPDGFGDWNEVEAAARAEVRRGKAG